MKYFIITLVCFASLHDSTEAGCLIDKLIKIITEVEKIFSTTLASNCQDLKQAFGMSYDQLVANNKTPDLNDIDVGLQVKNVSHLFNFTTAAEEILASPHYNRSLPLVIYIHGFLSTAKSPNVVQMVRSLVRRNQYNVLYLDASDLIFFFYVHATTCVQFIGLELGKVLANFVKGGVNPKQIHLIGFSLGAHISGFSGQSFKNITGLTIGRITGLDPAGPCYFNVDRDQRLSSDDADFVDAIHTDAGVLGIIRPVGDVDFYVNGGDSQPYCLLLFYSHLRAWQYYNETLLQGNEKNFKAVKCSSWSAFRRRLCLGNEKTYMGIGLPTNVTGKFYLRTADTDSYPFGLMEQGVVPIYDPFFEFLAWFLSLFGIEI